MVIEGYSELILYDCIFNPNIDGIQFFGCYPVNEPIQMSTPDIIRIAYLPKPIQILILIF